ncbi:uncharacterized protein [Arachis hypogaea]|uniref:uncharacterized protein n=1 Tax=Arachis hypogaea TaxID=3818 RepID=UPI003B2214D9
MLLALKSKNKLKFIDGSIVKPDELDPLFEAWEKCNTYLVSWITMSLSTEISGSVIWSNNASDLWKELKRRYYQGDKFRVAELQEELFQLRQGDATITAYYTKLQSIWEDLNNFKPILECTHCEQSCTCGLNVMQEFRRDDYTTRFLRGLNDQYTVVRLQLMLMTPMPDIDTAFSMLTQQERQFNDCQDSKIFFTKQYLLINQLTIEIEGKAEAKEDTKAMVEAVEASEKPSYDINSLQKEAIIKFLKGQEAQQQPQVTTQVQHPPNVIPMNQGKIVVLKYSSNISSFITAKSSLWVIDTGATDHVTFDINDYYSHYQVKPIIVRMPDSSYTTSSIIGTIRFSNQLFLSNDQATSKRIGVAKCDDGLYTMDSQPFSFVSATHNNHSMHNSAKQPLTFTAALSTNNRIIALKLALHHQFK